VGAMRKKMKEVGEPVQEMDVIMEDNEESEATEDNEMDLLNDFDKMNVTKGKKKKKNAMVDEASIMQHSRAISKKKETAKKHCHKSKKILKF